VNEFIRIEIRFVLNLISINVQASETFKIFLSLRFKKLMENQPENLNTGKKAAVESMFDSIAWRMIFLIIFSLLILTNNGGGEQ